VRESVLSFRKPGTGGPKSLTLREDADASGARRIVPPVGLLDRFAGSPRRRFAALALRTARRTPGVGRAEFHAGDFAIDIYRAGDGSHARLFLGNVFRETAGAPRAERLERLGTVLRVMAAETPEENWPAVAAKLRPVLRPATFGTTGQVGMRPPLARPALPFLHELVVVDHPEAMAYVVAHQVDAWGVEPAEVFAAAHHNLAELARRSLDRPWPAEPSLIRLVDDGDAYVASLLLAPGWLAAVSERTGRPVLAFAPDTTTLLLCPLPDGDAQPLYALVEAEYTGAVRVLSPVGYLATADGRVTPYAPPPGHPHHAATRRAAAVLAATEYGTQTDWLAGQYAANGIDVHVGTLLAVAPAAAAGSAQTVATWTAGVPALLPQADSVAFVHPATGVAFRAPWPAVAEATGLRPEPLLSPPRYRVDDWPPAGTMAALRRHALD
jgi:hypothetical protein